ncbi:2455_t:CDS:2, partial [Cetraspora pellucida]
MQENEELSAELVDLYEVSFISQTLEDLLAEEMLEDNDYDSNSDNTELKKTRRRKKDYKNKNRENNAGSEKKLKLPLALPDNNINPYGLIRLFFSQSILIKILTNTNEYAKSKNA